MADKLGQIKTNILMVIITMLFIIGILTSIFVLMTGEIKSTQNVETVKDGHDIILTEETQNLSNTPITSLVTTDYNNTWLDCIIDSSLLVNINESKETVSIWFKNDTTPWTSLIKSGDNIYINGSLDTNWTWLPYYISGDDLIFCKSNTSTFLNISIDTIRIYEQELNSNEVTQIYNYGK